MSTIKFTVEMGKSTLFPGTYWLNVDNERPEWAELVDGRGGLSEGDIDDPYEMAQHAGWLVEDVIRRQVYAAFGVVDPNGGGPTPWTRHSDGKVIEV